MRNCLYARNGWTMKFSAVLILILAVLAVSVLVLSSCTSESDNGDSQDNEGPAPEVLLPAVEGVDGSLVYISECGPCHGVSRQGLLGPALDEDMSIVFLSAWLPVHKMILDYLTVDEEKHDKLLSSLEEFKKNLYPYG